MRVRGRAGAGGPGSVAVQLVLLCLLLTAIGGCAPAAPGTVASVGASASAVETRPASDPLSGLPTIARADLPTEARAVLTAIGTSGPFTYSQDGAVFENRERILPARTSGYYHEYTVPTAGSPDRGARRLVTGNAGEVYFTADHYASYLRVWP